MILFPVLAAAIITLTTGEVLTCEQVTIEKGQVACFNGCDQKRCDGTPFCEDVRLVHPSYVQDIKL